jgi:hypothetical protein
MTEYTVILYGNCIEILDRYSHESIAVFNKLSELSDDLFDSLTDEQQDNILNHITELVTR